MTISFTQMNRNPEQKAEELRIRELHRLNPIREVPSDTITNADAWRMLKFLAVMKREREAQGLSLEELAKRAAVDLDVLTRLEAAHSFNPTVSILFRIARAVRQELRPGDGGGNTAMIEEIKLVDRGRGLQLSNNRITVADLVPYFRHGRSYEEIMWAMPSLTRDEIALVEAYYRERKEELDERDRQLDEYRAEQARLQRLQFPPLSKEERERRLEQLRRARHEGGNGQGPSSGR